MKNVLLIGDSIREHYQNKVQELLGDDIKVFHPNENCRFSKYTLWGMHAWMEEVGNPRIDVIHWNTGIWDLHRLTADGEIFTPIDEYALYTERLYKQMNSYTDKLIWATITPAGKDLYPQYCVVSQDVWNKDVETYNEVATKILLSKGNVVINDLYNTVLPYTDIYISKDGVHPTPAGTDIMAKQVADSIQQILKMK